MPDPTNLDPFAIRRSLAGPPRRWGWPTQLEFAELLGVPVASVRCWEQGRRKPDAAARTLLRLIEVAPVETLAVLEKARAAAATP